MIRSHGRRVLHTSAYLFLLSQPCARQQISHNGPQVLGPSFLRRSCECVRVRVHFLPLALSGDLSDGHLRTPAVSPSPPKADGGWAGLASMTTKDPPLRKEKVLRGSLGFYPGPGSEWAGGEGRGKSGVGGEGPGGHLEPGEQSSRHGPSSPRWQMGIMAPEGRWPEGHSLAPLYKHPRTSLSLEKTTFQSSLSWDPSDTGRWGCAGSVSLTVAWALGPLPLVCHSLGDTRPLPHSHFGSSPGGLGGKSTLSQWKPKEWVLVCAIPTPGRGGRAPVPPGASQVVQALP